MHSSFPQLNLTAAFTACLPKTVIKWAKQMPPDYIFCPKMSRYLTHMKKLKEPEEPLERFFSVFEKLKKKMGPVLIQLPPVLKFNYYTADTFIAY
jgi:uncharacterized protein YecE (DUF72 family)